jgi:hypothetical protein
MTADPFVDAIPDSADAEVTGLIGTNRLEAAKDDVFEFENSPLESSDVKVANRASGKGFETAGSLDDDEFEAFRSTLSGSDAFSFQRNESFWRADMTALDAPDPAETVEDRSPEAVEADRARKARVTTDVDLYASDPAAYDYPFVDTPPEFTEEFSESGLVGRHVNHDEIHKRAEGDGVFRY